jgi:hypothetical protein
MPRSGRIRCFGGTPFRFQIESPMNLHDVTFAENLTSKANEVKVAVQDESPVNAHEVRKKLSQSNECVVDFGKFGVVHLSVVIPGTDWEPEGCPEFEHAIHQADDESPKPKCRFIVRKPHAKSKPWIDEIADTAGYEDDHSSMAAGPCQTENSPEDALRDILDE